MDLACVASSSSPSSLYCSKLVRMSVSAPDIIFSVFVSTRKLFLPGKKQSPSSTETKTLSTSLQMAHELVLEKTSYCYETCFCQTAKDIRLPSSSRTSTMPFTSAALSCFGHRSSQLLQCALPSRSLYMPSCFSITSHSLFVLRFASGEGEKKQSWACHLQVWRN